MNHRFVYQDSLQDQFAEGMDAMRIALDQEAPYLALATARETARAALAGAGPRNLEPGVAPRREPAPLRAGKQELALLREVATATSQRFASRPAERQALGSASATLALLDRLFPPASAHERTPHAPSGRHTQVNDGAAPPGTDFISPIPDSGCPPAEPSKLLIWSSHPTTEERSCGQSSCSCWGCWAWYSPASRRRRTCSRRCGPTPISAPSSA